MTRRVTVVLSTEDDLALERASVGEGLSRSELIRRGIRLVTARYRRRGRPLVGWLRLSQEEREELARDRSADRDL